MTKFHYYSLAEASNTHGVVVVIDVLCAFTTAAYALANGIRRIYPVALVEEALQYKSENKEFLLMGDVDGIKPAPFLFVRSPGGGATGYGKKGLCILHPPVILYHISIFG